MLDLHIDFQRVIKEDKYYKYLSGKIREIGLSSSEMRSLTFSHNNIVVTLCAYPDIFVTEKLQINCNDNHTILP